MSVSDVAREDRLLLADGSYATVLGHVGVQLMAQVEFEGSTVFTVLDWTEAADKYTFMAMWRKLGDKGEESSDVDASTLG